MTCSVKPKFDFTETSPDGEVCIVEFGLYTKL